MCDYSLHGVANRPAKVGDKLVSTLFVNSFTRGFAEVGEPKVAVCLLPGTELQIDDPVKVYRTGPASILNVFGPARYKGGVARFRQINLHRPDAHHDALELPNGKVVLITNLAPGLKVRVLQLPVSAQGESRKSSVPTLRARINDRVGV